MKNIGIDIGASHISCGLYNTSTQILENKIYLLNKMDKTVDIDISTRHFINIIINLIDRLIIENNININEISSIGLGCPGGTNKENGIFLGSSSLNVSEINFRIELKKYNTKVFIENDCTCAGICESYINNLNNFIMFTLGSGLGISYMQDFKCINEIVWDIYKINKTMGINHDKYIKSFNSLSKRYNEIKNENYARCEIFKCLEKGDKDAKNVLKNYIINFIDGIRIIQSHYPVKDIVIGGGISEYSKHYIYDIRKEFQNINIHIAKHKNDSGIIGGALLEII
ncbi:MAG: ROK family protein [Clostridia bacterium]|nr:ROK family protein [Clostridia bacterium]